MAYYLERDALEAVALGGCFFGSGGGGTLTSAQHLLENFVQGDYYPTTKVKVVSVDEAMVGDAVMVAYMGAPEAINEVQYPEGPVMAAQQVQKRLLEQGRELAYVVAPESGALGFTVACLVAAKLGLAVLDADGAGRAVPELPMLTYAMAGISPRPAFLVSQEGLCVELDVTPRPNGRNADATHQQDVAVIVEQMMRPIVGNTDFKQFGGLAMWVMQPEQIKKALPITGTLQRALVLGQALRSGELVTAPAVVAFLREKFSLFATVLFSGECQSISLNTNGGFDLGQVCITHGQQQCTVVYENESLLAWDNTQAAPLAMAPDSLNYFVAGSGQPVYSNGDLMVEGDLNPQVRGRLFSIIGVQAAIPLRERHGIIFQSFTQLLGEMGYLGAYVPLPVAACTNITEEN